MGEINFYRNKTISSAFNAIWLNEWIKATSCFLSIIFLFFLRVLLKNSPVQLLILKYYFLYQATLLNYMGDVTSPGEFCVLPDGVMADPQGRDEKLKNPNGDVTAQLVVGVFINSSVLLAALSVSWVSVSQFSNCPIKLKFGDITERRFFTYS